LNPSLLNVEEDEKKQERKCARKGQSSTFRVYYGQQA